MLIGLFSYSSPVMGSGNTSPRAPLTNMVEANSPGTPPEDPLLKRLHDQQESLKRLQAMPSPKEVARQAEMAKVGFLKQRLESLKAILLYASPKQLKAIAKEIKAIAKELTSIAKNLSGGGNDNGGGGLVAHGGSGIPVVRLASAETVSPNAAAPNVAPNEIQAVEKEANMAATDAAHAMARQAEADMAEANATLPPVSSYREGTQRTEETPGSASANDNALQALLKDARKVLEEVVNQLKSKLAEADKETKRDADEAEKSLEELNGALARSHSGSVYTSLGGMFALSADASVSLPTIDISV